MKKKDEMLEEYDFSKGKRGSVIPQKGKTRITIFIDTDILEWFRDEGNVSIPPPVILKMMLLLVLLQCSIRARVDGNDPHAIRLALVFGVRHRQ